MPNYSDEFEPQDVRYHRSGGYDVTLIAKNDFESKELTKKIKVNLPLYDIDFELSSLEPPAELKISGLTSTALSYKWTFVGGSPEISEEDMPESITYTEGAEYQTKLEASNYDSTIPIIKNFYLGNW